MANKTIHELTELTQGNVGTSQELAIYDVSDNSTKRVTVGNLFGIDEFLTADDDDEPTGQVDFTSEDELNPTSTESVDLLTGNDSWSQRFYKVSQMFKNIRYILGKLGTTDISSIGNGTVTGAISNLNSKTTVQNLSSQISVTSAITLLTDCFLLRFGNLCVLQMRFRLNAATTANTKIAQLPVHPYNNNDNGHISLAFKIWGLNTDTITTYIQPDGSVNISANATTGNDYVLQTIFMCAN